MPNYWPKKASMHTSMLFNLTIRKKLQKVERDEKSKIASDVLAV